MNSELARGRDSKLLLEVAIYLEKEFMVHFIGFFRSSCRGIIYFPLLCMI